MPLFIFGVLGGCPDVWVKSGRMDKDKEATWHHRPRAGFCLCSILRTLFIKLLILVEIQWKEENMKENMYVNWLLVKKWAQQAVCSAEGVFNIIEDDDKAGVSKEMSQVLERLKTNEIPVDVRERIISEAKKRKVSPELLSAITKSILKYHELYKWLAKR